MSHHLDTPQAAQNGQLFIDDLFVFPGEDSTVFVMDVNSNVTGVYAQPGFHPEARYEIKVHRDGADFETLTYRITFGPPDSAGRQPLKLQALTGPAAMDDFADGDLLASGQTGEPIMADGYRIWAGRISDSFYIDLSLLGIVNDAVANGAAADLASWHPDQAKNSFANTTVESIVLEVPYAGSPLRPGTKIGVWCATKLATDAGGWRQVNRAGHPMMWPIFWPTDTDFTNPANARHPSQDLAAEGEDMAGRIAALVGASGTARDPRGYGEAVAAELLPDLLPYQVGTRATYGFAGFNGRMMADNAPEAMLSLVTSQAIPSGLTPATSEQWRKPSFPYVVPA